MNDFFTWTMLGTYAGCVLATTLVTQLFKGVSFVEKIPTRFFAYIVAFIILMLVHLVTNTFALDNISLAAINAVVVALAASGGYDAAKQVFTNLRDKE